MRKKVKNEKSEKKIIHFEMHHLVPEGALNTNKQSTINLWLDNKLILHFQL